MTHAQVPEPKPVRPTITDVNRPFWEGCGRGQLLVQRCEPCSHLRYPASIACPECLSPASKWHALSGRGQIFSFVVFQRAYHPAWESKVPYNVALIELDEGPIMLSNVVGIANDHLKIGMRVQVQFEPHGEGLAVPVFKVEN
jgi:uncharacterized OB-fold protein